jgi:prepilin-type N-terminal cleavage/methylation domain-containing protein
VVRRERGFSLLELVFTIAIFGMFLMMLVTLTAEMRGQEKRYPVNFMRHPQIAAVMARLRRDVLDASYYGMGANDPYPATAGSGKYTQGPKTLIVQTYVAGSGLQTVVWDFRVPTEVQRISYNVGVPTTWIARGLPRDFGATIDAVEVAGHPYGVRIQARDGRGRLALDQYLQPRAHE